MNCLNIVNYFHSQPTKNITLYEYILKYFKNLDKEQSVTNIRGFNKYNISNICREELKISCFADDL